MQAQSPRFAIFLLTLMLGLLWTVPPAQAAVVYVYTDDSGNIRYSDYMSTIPLKYRSKARVKYVPGKKSGSQGTTQGGADESQDSSSTSTSKLMGKTDPKKVGLSKEDEALLKEAQGILGQMVALADQFSGLRMSATTGRNMVNAIKSKMAIKEAFVKKIGGSSEPTLGSIKGFLESSITADKGSGTRSGTKIRLTAIKNRLVQDGEKGKELSDKINQAIADSNAKKQAAAKKKAEEEKKKKEEGKTESTEDKSAEMK